MALFGNFLTDSKNVRLVILIKTFRIWKVLKKSARILVFESNFLQLIGVREFCERRHSPSPPSKLVSYPLESNSLICEIIALAIHRIMFFEEVI